MRASKLNEDYRRRSTMLDMGCVLGLKLAKLKVSRAR